MHGQLNVKICIMCYHSTQTADIFPILQLFLIYPNGHSGWLRRDSHSLRTYTFISTPQHLPISIRLATMSCSTVSSFVSGTVLISIHNLKVEAVGPSTSR